MWTGLFVILLCFVVAILTRMLVFLSSVILQWRQTRIPLCTVKVILNFSTVCSWLQKRNWSYLLETYSPCVLGESVEEGRRRVNIWKTVENCNEMKGKGCFSSVLVQCVQWLRKQWGRSQWLVLKFSWSQPTTNFVLSCINIWVHVLGAFAKLRKCDYYLRLVRLSIRMELLGSHWTDFGEISYW